MLMNKKTTSFFVSPPSSIYHPTAAVPSKKLANLIVILIIPNVCNDHEL